MITQFFRSFKELYQTELLPREFDVTENRESILIAKYAGSFPLRAKDKDLEVKITKQQDAWKFTTDVNDNFYANRVHITLSEVKRLPIGTNCGTPMYGPGKIMCFDELQEGIPHHDRRGIILEFPLDIHDRFNFKFDICKSRIADYFKKDGYEISTAGFSPEEKRLFCFPFGIGPLE